MVLEEERVPGIGVELEGRLVDQSGDGPAVANWVELVGGAVGDEGGDRDRVCVAAGRVGSVPSLLDRLGLGRDRRGWCG